jgi:uncharacterized membrane-anchored protein
MENGVGGVWERIENYTTFLWESPCKRVKSKSEAKMRRDQNGY